MAKIDPRLTSKLNAALAEDKVKAVVTIITKPIAGDAGSTKSRANRAEKILDSMEKVTNQKPANYKYFPKLGVLWVEAANSFIQKLIENPEISTAALASEDDVYKM